MDFGKNYIKITWSGLATPIFLKNNKISKNFSFFSRLGFKKKKKLSLGKFQNLFMSFIGHIYPKWKIFQKNKLILKFCHFYEKNFCKNVEKIKKICLYKKMCISKIMNNFQENLLLINLINCLFEVNYFSTEKKKLFRISSTFFPILSENFFGHLKVLEGRNFFQKKLIIYFKKIAFLGPKFLGVKFCFYKHWRKNIVTENRKNAEKIFLSKIFASLGKKISCKRL